MKDKIKVFLEKEAFERFILKDYALNNLLAILSEHSILCLNMSEEDLDKEWKMSSLDGMRGGSKIKKFCTAHDMKRPLSASDVFSLFYDNPDCLLEYSRSLFLLNVTPEEADNMCKKYGLMIISKDNLSDDIFQFIIRDSVTKNELKDDYYDDGWDFFFGLRKHPWLPSNAIVFGDEYLFKNEIHGKNLGIRNLKSIITNILPKQLDIEFQILIVSPIPKNNISKAKIIANEMVEFVHSLPVPYDCKITFVFTNSIHARKAMSNYYVMTCDKGFCLYLCDPMNKVYDTNFVDITSNFHSAADSVGTNRYDDSSICLKDLRKNCIEAQEQAKAGIKTVLIAGDCGPNFEIYNRLLNINN